MVVTQLRHQAKGSGYPALIRTRHQDGGYHDGGYPALILTRQQDGGAGCSLLAACSDSVSETAAALELSSASPAARRVGIVTIKNKIILMSNYLHLSSYKRKGLACRIWVNKMRIVDSLPPSLSLIHMHTNACTPAWVEIWLRYLIIIIMYIYHALINALSTHMIHINLNMVFYTHVKHSQKCKGMFSAWFVQS